MKQEENKNKKKNNNKDEGCGGVPFRMVLSVHHPKQGKETLYPLIVWNDWTTHIVYQWFDNELGLFDVMNDVCRGEDYQLQVSNSLIRKFYQTCLDWVLNPQDYLKTHNIMDMSVIFMNSWESLRYVGSKVLYMLYVHRKFNLGTVDYVLNIKKGEK